VPLSGGPWHPVTRAWLREHFEGSRLSAYDLYPIVLAREEREVAIRYHRILRGLLAAFLGASAFLAGAPAWSAPASIGTASAIRAVEMSLDGGKTWFPLGRQAVPILGAADIRSAAGAALLDLGDGSRLNLLPFSTVRVNDTGKNIEVLLASGRLTFRLPTMSRVEIRTSSARLEPQRQEVIAGEAYVGEGTITGLRVFQGSAKVEELAGAKRTLVAGLEPVFLPKRPAGADQVFASSSAPGPRPSGGKAVFNPKGESLGYLGPDGKLVIIPGYTNDLTSAFPRKLVQAVMTRIPEADRETAVPVFDVNGRWSGYVVGSSFHGQDQSVSVAAAGGSGAGPGQVSRGTDLSWTAAGAIGAPLVAAAGAGAKALPLLPPRQRPPPASRFF
jgi:hypothetical protein